MPTIKFKSGGVHCAADLFLPDGVRPGEKRPGIVLGHGFSITRQSLAEEAEHFRKAGYVTLAMAVGSRISRGWMPLKAITHCSVQSRLSAIVMEMGLLICS